MEPPPELRPESRPETAGGTRTGVSGQVARERRAVQERAVQERAEQERVEQEGQADGGWVAVGTRTTRVVRPRQDGSGWEWTEVPE
ncbi:hypothetical protein [Streptosporangium minutum]|uniref:Uncharacterized protein n=1 Tax=Streptosporangium minutum TaxID=569862 RepID=A0A243Q7F6_9ACTN|nr:hypothetical protein [Streptosporangium minutum]OUC77453.1 hypothetical protein CA984_43505 [Streptosporangium minutum]